MPPSSDLPSSHQQSAVDPSLLYQEEATRKPSPGRKGHGKKSKKHEAKGESREIGGLSMGLAQAITSPPIDSRIQPANVPPNPPNGAPSPPIQTWEERHATQYVDTILKSDTSCERHLPYGRSPPSLTSERANMAGSPPSNQPPFEELRGGFTHMSPPISPRAAYRQPAQKASDYQSFGEYLGSSPNNRRPPSMKSHNSYHPPLPHQSQAHYHGVPDLDFGLPKIDPDDGILEEGSSFSLDSLPLASHESVGNSENVLLVGHEHCLNIYRVEKKNLDRIGRLAGLRGIVVGAKILPQQSKLPSQAAQPIVAVIIHGVYLSPGSASQDGVEQGDDGEFDASKSMLQAMLAADGLSFQTTVEVYSLRKAEHVATLLKCPKVEATGFRPDGQADRPRPSGDLKIHANGKFIVISSGKSGEAFIFETVLTGREAAKPSFQCIGKIWTRTTLIGTKFPSMSTNESDQRVALESTPSTPEATMLSLGHRWLAFMPPPPSSAHSTLHCQLATESNNITRIPGLSSHAAPAEPQITCDLDTPKDVSVLSRVAKDVTQGALKSAQWVAAEGLQAWQSYWNKPSESNQQALGRSPPHGLSAPMPPSHSFPPTHAQDNANISNKHQPALVSILDLETLSKSQHLKHAVALHPFTTFSLPSGGSALSFSPSGLNLLTASAKGDEQQVWDLMRVKHGAAGRVGDLDVVFKRPTVRQIARYSRVTPARIVDIVWTEPRGERFAIITVTSVHVFDLPASAFQWPPFRHTQNVINVSSKLNSLENDGAETKRPQSMGSTFGSAFGMFSSTTQSVLGSVRGRNSTPSTGFSGLGGLATTAGVGAKSGKAVAAGFNRSVSAAASGTVNTLRHLGENRFALPSSPGVASPGCACWLSGKDQGSIAIVCGGLVQVRRIGQSSNPKAGKRRPSVIADSPAKFSVPKEKTFAHNSQNDRRPGSAGSPAGSFWLQSTTRPSSRKTNLDTHPLSFAEIETNAPYQPFHTDRRVNIFAYKDDGTTDSRPHQGSEQKPWAFGEAIPVTQINVGSATKDANETGDPRPRKMENEIRIEGNVEDGRQIVMTTRLKKKRKGVGGETEESDGEIFEDDCEIVDHADERV